MSMQIYRYVGLLGLAVLAVACVNEPREPASRVPETADAPSMGCNRNCLLERIDVYLEALAANDPSQAPFASNARFTENAQVLTLGDGLWRTATRGPETYKLTVADPATAQAGFYALMEENGRPIWLAGRLRIRNREISELETVVLRSDGGFGNFEHDLPHPVWDEVLEPDQRRPREALIEIADRYLEALDENLADFVPFHPDCDRIENGIQTTNNPAASFGGEDGPNVSAMSCRDNVNSMMWHYITEIDPRRFVAVDEERGIVFGVFMFHHDGTYETIEIPGFGEYTYGGATRRPFTTVIPEMFKIVDGRILRIEAVMTALPYGSKSGWDDL